MATKVSMRHKDTGIMKDGFYGFSWTTFCFGFIPALFRGDYKTFLGGFAVSLILGIATFGIAWLVIGIVWAFMYNNYYTKNLIEQGYIFYDGSKNAEAAKAIGVSTKIGSFQASNNKTCPYCAEAIKAEAIICRYCGKDQPKRERLSQITCDDLYEKYSKMSAEERKISCLVCKGDESRQPCDNCNLRELALQKYLAN